MRKPKNYLNILVIEQDEIIDSFITWVGQHIEENDIVQKNVVLCLLYNYIDFLAHNYHNESTEDKEFSTDYYDATKTNRFPSKVYDLIYNIRLNEFKDLTEMAAGIPSLAPFVKRERFEWSTVPFGGKKQTKRKRKHKRTKKHCLYYSKIEKGQYTRLSEFLKKKKPILHYSKNLTY
jgi:hypothetical protein